MSIKTKKITIKEYIDNYKLYNFDLPYQRDDDAWSKKNIDKFLDSIINNYFIPPIILNKLNDKIQFDVLDGKQRLTTIKKIYDNKEKYKLNINSFLKRELIFIILDINDVDNVKEMFLRINKGSINLNKSEFIMANMSQSDRNIITQIANDNNFKNICEKKKNDKRFNRESIVIWLWSSINISLKYDNKSLRNYIEDTFIDKKENIDINDIKNFKKTFEIINEVIKKENIPTKSFKTIITAIFVSIYSKREHKNIFISNKEKINDELSNVIVELSKDQMGGGIKFDSIKHIRNRIDKVNSIFDKYINNSKRQFGEIVKFVKLKEQNYKCSWCNCNINLNISDADHIFPYSKGGLTSEENLQVLCKNCNSRKSNKF